MGARAVRNLPEQTISKLTTHEDEVFRNEGLNSGRECTATSFEFFPQYIVQPLLGRSSTRHLLEIRSERSRRSFCESGSCATPDCLSPDLGLFFGQNLRS